MLPAAWHTLKELLEDPRWLGALPGAIGAFQSWDDEMREHCHLHFIVTAGGVIVEVSAVNPEDAARRLESLQGIPELSIDEEVKEFVDQLISKGGFPFGAEADALHVAVASVHRIDYLFTWNFGHIDNAEKKPIIRSICVADLVPRRLKPSVGGTPDRV